MEKSSIFDGIYQDIHGGFRGRAVSFREGMDKVVWSHGPPRNLPAKVVDPSCKGRGRGRGARIIVGELRTWWKRNLDFLVGDMLFPDVSVMIYTISVCINRLVSTSKNYLFDHSTSYMSKYFLI